MDPFEYVATAVKLQSRNKLYFKAAEFTLEAPYQSTDIYYIP